MDHVGIAIPTNGRCAPLLVHLVQRWLSLGAEVATSGNVEALTGLQSDRLKLVRFDPSPQTHGDRTQAALDKITRPFALLTDDDVLPVNDDAWHEKLPLEPRSIQSIRLLSVLGQRWADWAVYRNNSVYNQPYDQRQDGTYITGACQLISPEVRAAISYRGRRFHDWNCDIGYCYDAVAKGFGLRPPLRDGALLIHLDRLRPHPTDPERNGVPFIQR